jgi:thioredoxin 2
VPAARLDQHPTCGKCKKRLFTAEPIDLRTAAFDHFVAHTDLPVVVDFWAPWCGPCRSMAPHFKEAAGMLEPRVRFVKVNSDDESSLAARFNIRSIPTLVILQRGTEIARQSGALPRDALVRWIAGHLPAG